MNEFMGSPLFSTAADTQQRLTDITQEFYQGFVGNRPTDTDVVSEPVQQRESSPFTGLIPIPSLSTDRVNIDFQIEETATNKGKNTSTSSAEGK